MNWIGRSLPRIEDPALLRGQGRFTADLAAGALRVAFVRSPFAAGRLLGIEAPAGAQVFTAADMGALNPIRPRLFRPDYVAVGQPVLAAERVHFAGQAVAMAVAPGAAAAEDLAEAVFLDIEPEVAVIGLEAALAPDAPAVHPEAPGNVLVEGRMRSPGLDAAFAAAAQVVTVALRSGRQSAMPLEARGGVARFDPATGRVTLFASVQMPQMLRTGIADTLGMREADLRVVAPDVGGGFGQKMSLFPEYPALVWLARHLGRDVAWIEDRRENFLASAHSRDQAFTVRGAFDPEGRLAGLEGDLISDVGAFSCYPVTCGVEPLMAFAELPGPYRVPEYGVRSRGVTTNSCMMAPYRGVSRPNLTLAMELLMDRAAAACGLAPEEIRRRNLVTAFPHRSPTGLEHDEGTYVAAMEQALEKADVAGFRAAQAAARAEGRLIGLGISVFSERSGYGTPAFAARGMEIVPGYETVEASMDPSGNVELRIGASPHGQGLRTSLAQLVADEMGTTPDRVRIIAGDTDAVPYGWGTFASRSMVISGGACKRASAGIATQLRAVAARMLEVAPETVTLENGSARSDASNRVLDLSEVARAAHHQSHRFPEVQGGLRQSATYDPAGTFSNACHIAQVEVDPETGQVRIDRFVVVEDAGLLINPMIVDGQIHGGVAQGIANALYEEVVYDPDGNLLTASLADFLVPTMAEIPRIEIGHLDTRTDASETGAKGVGEGGTIGAPAAVLNAINDALAPLGAAIHRVPATPERIRAAIRTATGKQP
jgi:carbon-monoxide dehydrogenase large subunit